MTDSPYLTTAEAAHYVGFRQKPHQTPSTPIRSFQEWARRRDVHPCKGRQGMWVRDQLDAAMQQGAQAVESERVSAVADLARADARRAMAR
jgi:hypothetical protein